MGARLLVFLLQLAVVLGSKALREVYAGLGLTPPAGAPPCSWDGVTCDATGAVVALDLPSRSLSGSLLAAVGQLDTLTRLNLAQNALAGPVPRELGRLAGLRELDLQRNALTG